MKRLLLSCLALLVCTVMWGQRTVTGTITDNAGEPLIGANVVAKGTTAGTITDYNGEYELTLPEGVNVIVVSYTGYQTKEIEVGDREVVDVTLLEGVQLTEAVVTALGISREKKSLGYATQEVGGDEIDQVKTDNFVESLSGRVAGVNIRQNNNMGGSTDIEIRGNTSLTGNNQPLFVVDGIPISNRITNSRAQEQAGTGYDYGNAASDINPANIKSINVLKGAAATALYGSRAANGVVMITTKEGTSKEGIGVEVNSGVTIGTPDEETFVTYQDQYGAGYGTYYGGPGGYWFTADVNEDGTDDLVTPLSEDASYGAPFDPNLMVYHWDAFVPESDNFKQARPWVPADNGPIEFFETATTLTNSIAVNKAYDKGSFRASYSNYNHSGMLPNSELERNTFSLKSDYEVTDRLTVEGYGSFIDLNTEGRNKTGYAGNLMTNFRQWWQTNVDVKEQEAIYDKTGLNYTWNPVGPGQPLNPIYWNNLYFQRHENYETDGRTRFMGHVSATYEITDWLEVMGRVTADVYDEIQEERLAIGSVADRFGVGTRGLDGSLGRLEVTSGYSRRDINSSEFNFDLMLRVNKQLSDKWSLSGILGSNIRRNNYDFIFASTNGGINIPDLYALRNSASSILTPVERHQEIGVNGVYANASLGFDGFLFLEGSIRRDRSSTLPEDNDVYYYPSASASFVFTRFIDADWLSFGKFRANYAQVGSDAPFASLVDVYNINTPIRSASASVPVTKNNPDLKPVQTKSKELGLTMEFVDQRLGFDFAAYQTNSVDQILPVAVTSATGYAFKILNAGEMENRGFELNLFGTPVRGRNFSWDFNINWSTNENEVVQLAEGLDNLQLGSFQGGVTINAKPGEPYGAIFGTDYTYIDGQRVVDPSNGRYISTDRSDIVIGDPNPDWRGGVSNTFSYNNLSLSFLIDIQQGGDIFSLDQYYGLATGLYPETAGNNESGNPIRSPVEEGGGLLNEGVNPDGSVNETRIQGINFGSQGYARGLPNSAFVYDASFVKLRNVTLTYRLPDRLFDNNFIRGIDLSLSGNNLWIIDKNFPYADPESGLGAGNLQGYSTGSLPTLREFTFNVKLKI